jgi:hypothetical protein
VFNSLSFWKFFAEVGSVAFGLPVPLMSTRADRL